MSNARDMDQLLQGFVDRGLPGCGLKVTRRGETVYEGYFGHADIKTGAPVTKRSAFRQASTSKLPLYTAAMMLYEQGRFLMTDPLYEYLPEYRESTKVVRRLNGQVDIVKTDRPLIVRDALTMRCGLPYCNGPADDAEDLTLRYMSRAMRPLWDKGHYTNREQVRAMAAVPLAFEPGTHWLYGFGSELTCALVEAVTGKGVDQVLEEMIFTPLEMDDTRSHFFGDAQDRLVKLYAIDDSNQLSPLTLPFERTFLPGEENEMGWARLFATVGDYCNLMTMLANGGFYKGHRLMGRKTIDLMRTNVLDEVQMADYTNPYEAGYGYGYGVRTLLSRAGGDVNGSPGAFGWTGGFGTWCEADPEEGAAFVYMHNLLPDRERYYHPRVRAAAYGLIE